MSWWKYKTNYTKNFTHIYMLTVNTGMLYQTCVYWKVILLWRESVHFLPPLEKCNTIFLGDGRVDWNWCYLCLSTGRWTRATEAAPVPSSFTAGMYCTLTYLRLVSQSNITSVSEPLFNIKDPPLSFSVRQSYKPASHIILHHLIC